MSLPESERRRTARHLRLPGFGIAQQEALHRSHVLIVGAGGLGCPAIQQLAAAGVGHLTLIDDDVVSISNIHRQILFGASDCGAFKVDVAALRARELQPGIRVTTHRHRLTAANAVALFEDADIVVEGSDNFATKYLCADAAEITSTPLAWGTVLRFAGDVCLFHSGSSTADGRGVGLRDVFPVQPESDFVADCATAGVLGVTTSVVAGLMATQVIMHLTGFSTSPTQLTHYEALSSSLTSWTVTADPGRPLVTELADSYESPQQACSLPRSGAAAYSGEPDEGNVSVPSLSAQDMMGMIARGEAVAVDIREMDEVLCQPWPGCEPFVLPMSTTASLPEQLRGKTLIVACAVGIRSEIFRERFYEPRTQIFSLPGGIEGLVSQAGSSCGWGGLSHS